MRLCLRSVAPTIKVGNGIGNPIKKSDTRKATVCGDVHAAVENQARRNTVDCRSHQRHGGRICRVGPTEPRDFRGNSPFSVDRVGIRQGGEVVAVVTACSGTADKFGRFIEIKMMLAKIPAGKNPSRLAHSPNPYSRSRRRNRRRVQHGKGRPPAFLCG